MEFIVAFTPHTQDELKQLNIIIRNSYDFEYANKDYFNAQESLEKGEGVAFESDGNIYLTVLDTYAMDKIVMQVRV